MEGTFGSGSYKAKLKSQSRLSINGKVNTEPQPSNPERNRRRYLVKGVAIAQLAMGGSIIGFFVFMLLTRCDWLICGLFLGGGTLLSLLPLVGGIFLILSRKGGLYFSYIGLGIVIIVFAYFWGTTFTYMGERPLQSDLFWASPIALSAIMIALLAIGQGHMKWKKPFIPIE